MRRAAVLFVVFVGGCSSSPAPAPAAQSHAVQWETLGGIRITRLENVCLYEGPPGAYGGRSMAAIPIRDLPAGAGCE